VYDGLLTSYNISFAAGIRSSLNECFKEAKARLGIVTSLLASPETIRPTKAAPRKSVPASASKEKAGADLTVELLNRKRASLLKQMGATWVEE